MHSMCRRGVITATNLASVQGGALCGADDVIALRVGLRRRHAFAGGDCYLPAARLFPCTVELTREPCRARIVGGKFAAGIWDNVGNRQCHHCRGGIYAADARGKQKFRHASPATTARWAARCVCAFCADATFQPSITAPDWDNVPEVRVLLRAFLHQAVPVRRRCLLSVASCWSRR